MGSSATRGCWCGAVAASILYVSYTTTSYSFAAESSIPAARNAARTSLPRSCSNHNKNILDRWWQQEEDAFARMAIALPAEQFVDTAPSSASKARWYIRTMKNSRYSTHSVYKIVGRYKAVLCVPRIADHLLHMHCCCIKSPQRHFSADERHSSSIVLPTPHPCCPFGRKISILRGLYWRSRTRSPPFQTPPPMPQQMAS